MNENKPRRRAQAQAAQKATRKSGLSRFVLMVTMMALVAVVSIGGTMAWLQDNTEAVTNTFTTTGIDIELIETKKPDGTEVTTGVTDWSAPLVPSVSYSKNPTVTVVGADNNVDVYLFVKFTPGDSKTYLDYTSAWEVEGQTTWTELTDGSNIWYTTVAASASNTSFELIKDNTVKVKDALQKADEDASTLSMPSESVMMSYQAYAIQTAGFETDVVAAWNAISK